MYYFVTCTCRGPCRISKSQHNDGSALFWLRAAVWLSFWYSTRFTTQKGVRGELCRCVEDFLFDYVIFEKPPYPLGAFQSFAWTLYLTIFRYVEIPPLCNNNKFVILKISPPNPPPPPPPPRPIFLKIPPPRLMYQLLICRYMNLVLKFTIQLGVRY